MSVTVMQGDRCCVCNRHAGPGGDCCSVCNRHAGPGGDCCCVCNRHAGPGETVVVSVTIVMFQRCEGQH